MSTPQFFVTRPDRTMVPLIAVDELPPSLSLRGVKRSLTPNDTQGMTSLGGCPCSSSHYYIVDTIPTGHAAPIGAGQHHPNDIDMASTWTSIGADDIYDGYHQVADACPPASQPFGIRTATGWSASNATVPPTTGPTAAIAPAGESGPSNNKVSFHFPTDEDQ